MVSGCYRYVRNPIYVGFLGVLLGESLLFGSPGLLEYALITWCVGAAAVRWYEEPRLAREFGAEYGEYRRAVHAWLPGCVPGRQGTRPALRTPFFCPDCVVLEPCNIKRKEF